MKKFFLFICLFFIGTKVCLAKNIIYSIDMNIELDDEGNANITEIWHVDGSDGTEWYKVYENLGKSKISNFHVQMDGNDLTYKSWNINESLSQKKGYYGIVNKSNSVELCFGKYDYKEHTFTLTYHVSNFVFNTSDAQVLYWNLIDRLSKVDFRNFTVTVSASQPFSDDLAVWGYGYKGYAYVENGLIKMSNEGDMDNNYVVLLVQFPLDTFQTTYTTTSYDNFQDVLNQANVGTFSYDYDTSDEEPWWTFLFVPFIWCVIILTTVFAARPKYGYKDNKKIDKKNTPMFRDIPCNKDIYYANALVSLNHFGPNNCNILGAILLKWIKMGVVTVSKDSKKTSLILNRDKILGNSLEGQLFDIMYKASGDGVLEKSELERWARKNYNKYLDLLDKFKTDQIKILKTQGHIYKRTSRSECKASNVMDDTLYEESKKLYGLKLFLLEFSSMKEKEAIEVHLWDQYLMFAYLFGIADKVAKQFKNLYPEVLENSEYQNMDFETIYFLNHISTSSVSAASSARSAAQSYSSGGGGFSVGGGGGGSFGGGGGGSR